MKEISTEIPTNIFPYSHNPQYPLLLDVFELLGAKGSHVTKWPKLHRVIKICLFGNRKVKNILSHPPTMDSPSQ
jgi:hypothetical protein